MVVGVNGYLSVSHLSWFTHFNDQFPGLYFDSLVNCRWKSDQSQNARLNGIQWSHAAPV